MLSSGEQGKNHVTTAERKKRRGGAVERDSRRPLASAAGTDRKRLRYLTLYTSSVSFPIRLKTRRGSWSSKSTAVLVNLLTVGSATHTMHKQTGDLKVFCHVPILEITPSSNTPEPPRSKTCTGPTKEGTNRNVI